MIRYSKIVTNSLVDGPGLRTAVFFQGCSIGCKGCQSKHLWPSEGGLLTTPLELAALVASLTPQRNYTIMGGEPFDQPAGLFSFLKRLRALHPNAHIIVYTGYTFEQLDERHPGWFAGILGLIDVLVDGPFIKELDDPLISYRGSRNQRPIDVPATRKRGELVLLNWDNPEIVIDPEGDLHLPIGLANEFEPVGNLQNSRRCGQSA